MLRRVIETNSRAAREPACHRRIALITATIILCAGVRGAGAQTVIDLGKKETRIGAVDYVKTINKGRSNIQLLKSANPSVATARRCGTNRIQILPHTHGETAIEFWDDSDRKLYLFTVLVGSRGDEGNNRYVGTIIFDGGSKLVLKNNAGDIISQRIDSDAGDLDLMVFTSGPKNGEKELKLFDYNQTAEGGGTVMYRIVYNASGRPFKSEVDKGRGWQPITNKKDSDLLERYRQIAVIDGEFDVCPGDARTEPVAKTELPENSEGQTGSTDGCELFFDNWNSGGVRNGAVSPRFRLSSPAVLCGVATYHWNNGQGREPGKITLINKTTGVTYGPYPATTTVGQNEPNPNVNWQLLLSPRIKLAPGEYEIVDSDPRSWSWNEASTDMGPRAKAAGFAKVWLQRQP